ncbi:MAG: 23S rRNA (pseudouridine(1915)-N(3))-methyltransferase RlmH [Clostridia bacterium]|nr:23S rRNA (pseudouridine(1915)-N(3))-methyltransferase RlmH [Clostridia bacterium]
MLKVKLVVLGKLKEKYWADAAKEYIKRLSGYCKIEVCEIKDLPVPENPSESEIETVLLKESEEITKQIGSIRNVVSLCIEGKSISSEELSSMLADAEMNGGSIAFVIGSSHGLHESIKRLSGSRISFSKMTFPHQLARIMLLEQIYRGFKIKKGENYHK